MTTFIDYIMYSFQSVLMSTIGASFVMQELGARGGRAEALLPVRQVAAEAIERAGVCRHTQLRGGLSGLSRVHSQAALCRAAGLQSARALPS